MTTSRGTKRDAVRMATLATAVAVLAAVPVAAVEPVSVLLAGHDQPLTGYLRQISDARFLLQGERFYHEFPGDQIVTVDGEAQVPASVRGSGRLIFTSFREKVLPDGDVEVWSHNEIVNRGATILTGTEWEATAWEEQQIRAMHVYDIYGNDLPVTILLRPDGSFRVQVDFVVPVAPRESLNLTLRTVRPGAALREGDVWRYTFDVDFAEDRYLTRKIELPPGASVVEAYAGCRGIELGDRMVLLSQRYFPAGVCEPLTIRYSLP